MYGETDFKCSEREQFETVAPIDRQAVSSGSGRLLPELCVSAFAPARPSSPPPRPLVDSVFQFAPAKHPVCVATTPYCFRISHCHVGWDHPLGFFTCCKTRRWNRSITIEIMIRLIPSLSRCLSTLLFLNSLYDFSLLSLVPFFFFFLFWSRISRVRRHA